MTNHSHLNKLHDLKYNYDKILAKITEEIRSGSNSMEESIRQAIYKCLIKSAISSHKSILLQFLGITTATSKSFIDLLKYPPNICKRS